MKTTLQLLLASAVFAGMMVPAAHAQAPAAPPPVPDGHRYIVTYLEVMPTASANGTALTKQLAEDGRKDDGNLRFEAVTQTNRQNHFTVIELWGDRKAADAHSTAAHTRAYRDKLGPASGALYDERLYKTLD